MRGVRLPRRGSRGSGEGGFRHSGVLKVQGDALFIVRELARALIDVFEVRLPKISKKSWGFHGRLLTQRKMPHDHIHRERNIAILEIRIRS